MFDFLSEKFSTIFSRFTGQSQLSATNIQDALDKIVGVDLRAVVVERSFQEDGDGNDRIEQDQPHQRPAFGHDSQHIGSPLLSS